MIWYGLLLPFLGTALGAGCVLFMRSNLRPELRRMLTGFAAGVMVAASIWSLLIPAMEQAEELKQWAFMPAVIGFWLGIAFLLILDRLIPHLHQDSDEPEGLKSSLPKTAMLVLAVTMAGALALALGIAIQNFPEGAIISMPLRSEGVSTGRALYYGILSGAVEPLAAGLTIAAASLVIPVLPYLLGFAAGAMLYVVVEELIPEMSFGQHSNWGTVFFALGFTLMLALDVGLG